MKPNENNQFAGHTPEPWRFVPQDNVIVDSTDRKIIAQPRSLHYSEPERDANGYLIAAAPALLRQRDQLREACRFAEEAFRVPAGTHPGKEIEALAKMRHALAQAEGEV